MEESVTKGLESLELSGSDADTRKSRSIGRIWVEGYDTSLLEFDVNTALRKHFSSCGEITHIYIPTDGVRGTVNRFAFIYLRGEDAYEKALELNGSDVGGWKVIAKPYPLTKSYLDSELAPKMRDASKFQNRRIIVTGYDTGLPADQVKSMLCENFCSSGEFLTSAVVPPFKDGLHPKAILHITGEEAIEKVLQRDNLGGYHIQVDKVLPLRKPMRVGGYSALLGPIHGTE